MPVLIEPHAHDRPDDPALVDATGTTTWGALETRVHRARAALAACGLEPGGTIAVVSENRRELYETFLAATHAGVRYVPVNWHWAPEELTYVFTDAAATTVVTSPRFAANTLEAIATMPEATRPAVLVFGDHAPDGARSYEATLASAPDWDAPEVLGGPMFYTSGTTGRPKGVRSSTYDFAEHPAKLAAAARRYGDLLQLPVPGTTLLSGPAYHSAQWAFTMHPLVSGACLVIRDKFDPAETLSLIERHGVTNCHLVPTQFVRLLRLPEAVRSAHDLSSLRICWHGAAPCSPDVKQQMIDWWGPIVHEYYGSTEGSIVSVISTEEWLTRPTSVGRPSPGIEVQVLDDEGNPAPPGTEGELFFRRPTRFEYHNDREKTERTIGADGWFTTGDCGFVDEDSYIHLRGRKIDMIISGGVNIYPAEIEAVLLAHPAVADVAVFGIPDDEFGEQVKAAVQVSPGHEPGDSLTAELIRCCRSKLAGYKAPKTVDYHDALPRLESGKLQKHLLRAPYWAAAGRAI